MKDQATTIEQSKRLIEMGVPAEKASMVRIDDADIPSFREELSIDLEGFERDGHTYTPAYTVADLLELLPMFIEQDDTYYLYISKCYEGWYVGYETEKGSGRLHCRGVELVDVLIETIDRLLADGYKSNV